MTVAAERTSAAAAWVRGFEEGWRAPGGPDALAEHFGPMVDPDVRLRQPQMPLLVGREGLRDGFARPLFELIPDAHAVVEEWAVRGDAAFIAIRLEGTLGGCPVSLRVVDRIALRDGVAVERESYLDPLPLLLAVLRRPRSWSRFLRTQAMQLRYRRRARRAGR
jgi:ketosteroid isomerase-like protein